MMPDVGPLAPLKGGLSSVIIISLAVSFRKDNLYQAKSLSLVHVGSLSEKILPLLCFCVHRKIFTDS